MKIIETRVSDSGMYLCVATNIAGNVTQSVKLNVHGEFWNEDMWYLCTGHRKIRHSSFFDSLQIACRVIREKFSKIEDLWFSFISSGKFVIYRQLFPFSLNKQYWNFGSSFY